MQVPWQAHQQQPAAHKFVYAGQDQLAWAQGAIDEGTLNVEKAHSLRSRDEPGRMPSPAVVDRAADGVAWAAGLPAAQVMNVVGVRALLVLKACAYHSCHPLC